MLKSSHLIKRLSRYAVAAFAMSASFQAFSYDFASDGLYYTISDMDKREVKVDKDEANPYSGDIVIPKTASFRNREFTVVGIENNVFTGNTNITSLSIKASISDIPANAFAGCSSIKTVEFNDDLETIEYGAFYECKALEKVIAAPMWVGSYAFKGCSNLSTVQFLERGGTIEENAFQYCNLKDISIPKSNRDIVIMPYAFDGNPIKSISLSNSVREIKNVAFGKVNIETLTIPGSVTRIYGNCIGSVDELIFEDGDEDLERPGGLKCRKLYYNRNGIKNSDEYYCFSNVDEIIFGEKVEKIPSKFARLTGKNSLVIPSTVKRIGAEAFCPVDDSVILPSIVIEAEDDDLILEHNINASIGYPSNNSNTYKIHYLESPFNLKIRELYVSRIMHDEELDFNAIYNESGWEELPDISDSWVAYFKIIFNPFFEAETLNKFVWAMNTAPFSGYRKIYDRKYSGWIETKMDRYFDVKKFSPNSIVLKSGTPPECDINFDKSAYLNTTLHIPVGSKEAYMNADVWKSFFDIVESEPAADVPVVGVDQNQPVVSVDNGFINISGLNETEAVRIYDVHGRLVYSGNECNIRLNRTGMFILKGDTFSLKVIL